MRWQTALRLGRVSNLPTVWSNVLAGMILAGGQLPDAGSVLILLAAGSLMYVGGMFLNDAFDAEIDARERAERPIPQGEVTRQTVFIFGFAMLGLGVAALAGFSRATVVAGTLLAAAILFYNWYHKNNPLSPVVMGLCRMLLYATAGLAVAAQPDPILTWAALALLAYLIGLTYVAKQENLRELRNLWPLACLAVPFLLIIAMIPDLPTMIMLTLFAIWTLYALSFLRANERSVPKTVVSLIAGMALLDASLMVSVGAYLPAVSAIGCFGITLIAQRSISGT